MDCLLINGGRRLSGSLEASGAKNATLPIMAAALLAQQPVHLARVPRLTDVAVLARVLRQLGVSLEHDRRGAWTLYAPRSGPVVADARLMHKMRASFCVLGPLLARRGQAVVALPGGCKIGERPIDLHLAGLAALGADLRLERGYVVARAKRLRGATVSLAGPHGPTVTGTANVLCAATLARGTTTILHAAREPEIVDLGRFLIALGARIEGLGTSTVEIQGVDALGGARYEIIPDRIEAATLLLAGAITGGDVRITRLCPAHLSSVLPILGAIGLHIETGPDWIRLAARGRVRAVDITAGPFPDVPTDLQAQLTALLCLATGRSQVRDTVFPERFQHVRQLARLGARLTPTQGGVSIAGVPELRGARLTACDLRASAALVLAGLAARGRTQVRCAAHLDRGYERLDAKLAQLGASIARVHAAPASRPTAAFAR
jgi:UDP-N-acetylglucosamine 1-carboxyvinyltransferase